ncbi:MAG: alkaline shock response membrane anchor protein AmaP [Bifidobacterium sp.]|jgi:hypothetical protein|nr:alkaline shock response membrane anchor protein AmaP [Bifidobacterium sp.]
MSEQQTTSNANRSENETENVSQACAQDSMDTTSIPAYENSANDDAGATDAESAAAEPGELAATDGSRDEESEVLDAMGVPRLAQNRAAKPVDATGGSEGAEEASTSVPLYATEPPRDHGLPHEGDDRHGDYAPQDVPNPQNVQPSWDQRRHHHGQPYVQVPREMPPLAPIVAKTGPSVPTIVLGTLGLVLGAVIGAFGLLFPMDVAINPVVNVRIAVALVCAILGVILIAVALIWALVSLLRRRGSRSDTDDAKVSKAA